MSARFPEFEEAGDDEEDRSGVSFELVRVAWRRKTLIFLVVILSVLVAILISTREAKQYESSASLLFRDPGFSRVLSGNGLFDPGQDPKRAAQTNIDVVGSTNVAEVVKRALKTNESADSLARSVTVTPSSDSDVAKVTATRSSPEEAAQIANAFADGYIRYRQSTDRAAVQNAKDLIHQSLQTATPDTRPGLLDSLRQLEVLRTVQTGNAEVIARAQPDPTPVSPRPKRNAIFGFILGVLAGFGLALLIDFLDRRLQREEDVEHVYAGYPLLTTVPDDRRDNEVVEAGGRTGEAYRMLRESLRFVDQDRTARCLLVTSADESEGKSSVARHFAVTLASSGAAVVLVEADMRRPTASRKLGIDGRSMGLSNLLVSNLRVRHLLLKPLGPDSTLSVLPAGPVPARPADLLRTPRAAEVLEQLREQAEIIIVDAPPLLAVADTRALLQLPQIDGVIMVGRVRVTRRDRAAEARRVLRQSGRRVIGLVVNGGSHTAGSSYYNESPSRAKRLLFAAR